MRDIRIWLFAMVTMLAACRGGGAAVPIEAGAPCAFCRMTIADTHLGGEVVAPGDEPRFYDDIGCLAGDLVRRAPAGGARVFVADYRTGALVPAASAVYTRVEAIATPMGSHLVAHADAAARDADPRTRGGTPRTPRDVFGGAVPFGGADGR